MPKTVVITGASSGIGKALTQYLATAGHFIIAVARNEKILQELHSAYPANVCAIAADVTRSEDIKKIQQSIPYQEQGIYLVNNAGIAIPRLLINLTDDEWEQHYLINTKAPLLLAQLLLPHLKSGGRILNVSSGLAHYPLPGMLAYGVTKAALYMMKEYFNSELKDFQITCGSAMPGVVDTPIQERIRRHNNAEFPSVHLFQDFKVNDELLSPITAAKFLTYVLMETADEYFIKNDWNIYETSHHIYWAEPGEVKQRKN